MSNKREVASSFEDAQKSLVIQTADLPLGTLAEMVENKSIDLEPSFQRRERWKDHQQSALIESFLLNVPVPPIYLSEEKDGKYTAIDGKQRLKAISDFISGRLRLKGLEKLTVAENLRFIDLPDEITNAFRLRPFLRVVTLLKQTNPELKYEVFLRLNKGGEALTAQEIRNVAFRGPLNSVIYELAEHVFLKQQLKITNEKSSAYRQMLDAEYVLRFLTLSRKYKNFSGRLLREMDNFMRKHQSGDEVAITHFSKRFLTALGRCQELWGRNAFRRPDGDNWRDQTLAGMYDAQMLAVSELSEDEYLGLHNKRAQLTNRTRLLFSDAQFDQAVRTGTNTPARITYRVDKMLEVMRSI